MDVSEDTLEELDIAAAVFASEAKQMEQLQSDQTTLELGEYSRKVVISRKQWAIYKKDFDAVDADGDGQLQLSEIQTMLENQLERKVTEAELQQWMEEFDANKDGFVSLVEWISAVIGKEFSLATDIDENDEQYKDPHEGIIDKDGLPLAIGKIYVFTGGG